MEFDLPSHLDSIDTAVSRVTEFASSLGFSDDALFAIDLGLREAVANAVKHGNKFDETKKVHLRLKETANGLEIAVRDFGSGFDIQDVPDPTNPENLLKESGRGILFINNFMDKVEWLHHDDGTTVRMLKNR